MEKRVVITGLGAITPIGNNVEETWNGIENKKCGIDKITLIDASTYKTKLAAEVKNFNPLEHFEPKHKRNKTGRNDPCPCNSGIKYKKCCYFLT